MHIIDVRIVDFWRERKAGLVSTIVDGFEVKIFNRKLLCIEWSFRMLAFNL